VTLADDTGALFGPVAPDLARLEDMIRASFADDHPAAATPMADLFASGGKRLRPALEYLRAHPEVREVIVPPEKRVLDVAVTPSHSEYKPGQPATIKVKLTDANGKPFVGSTVLTMYDKSVEYISGGSNVPEIKEFFWKWRRHHSPQTESSLNHWLGNLLRQHEIGMSNLGVFGATVVEEVFA